ncbi:hypothetical protein BsWGS_25861 [Bradybaena similaris]
MLGRESPFMADEESDRTNEGGHGPGDVAARGHGPGDVAARGHGPGDVAAPGHGPGDVAAPGHGPGDVAAPGHGPGDVAAPGHGPGDVAAPGHGPGDVAARGHGPGDVAAPGHGPGDVAAPGHGPGDVAAPGHGPGDVAAPGHGPGDVAAPGHGPGDVAAPGHGPGDVAAVMDGRFLAAPAPSATTAWSRVMPQAVAAKSAWSRVMPQAVAAKSALLQDGRTYEGKKKVLIEENVPRPTAARFSSHSGLHNLRETRKEADFSSYLTHNDFSSYATHNGFNVVSTDHWDLQPLSPSSTSRSCHLNENLFNLVHTTDIRQWNESLPNHLVKTSHATDMRHTASTLADTASRQDKNSHNEGEHHGANSLIDAGRRTGELNPTATNINMLKQNIHPRNWVSFEEEEENNERSRRASVLADANHHPIAASLQSQVSVFGQPASNSSSEGRAKESSIATANCAPTTDFTDTANCGRTTDIFTDTANCGQTTDIFTDTANCGQTTDIFTDTANCGQTTDIFTDTANCGQTTDIFTDTANCGQTTDIFTDTANCAPTTDIFTDTANCGQTTDIFTDTANCGQTTAGFTRQGNESVTHDPSYLQLVVKTSLKPDPKRASAPIFRLGGRQRWNNEAGPTSYSEDLHANMSIQGEVTEQGNSSLRHQPVMPARPHSVNTTIRVTNKLYDFADEPSNTFASAQQRRRQFATSHSNSMPSSLPDNSNLKHAINGSLQSTRSNVQPSIFRTSSSGSLHSDNSINLAPPFVRSGDLWLRARTWVSRLLDRQGTSAPLPIDDSMNFSQPLTDKVLNVDKKCLKQARGSPDPGDSENPQQRKDVCGEKSHQAAETKAETKTAVYKKRWYLLLLFSVSAMLWNAVWSTWGPIAQSAKDVYQWTDADIAMFIWLGNIPFLLTMFPCSYLMDVKGMRIAMIVACGFMFLGTGCRCIPSDVTTATWLIRTGQFLNGMAGTIPNSAPALLSALWFPPNQRASATAISTVAGYMGASVSFVIGPLLVPQPNDLLPVNNTDDLPSYDVSDFLDTNNTNITSYDAQKQGIMHILYAECAVAGVLLLLVLLYFPSKPPLPPSVSASMPREKYIPGLKMLVR